MTMAFYRSLFPVPFFILYFLPLSIQQQTQIQNLTSFSNSDSPWLPAAAQILISPNMTFAAGFHRLSTSPQTYIFAIWYLNRFNTSQKTIVWSLNGDQPINGTTSLVVTPSGGLVLSDSAGNNLRKVAAGRSNGSRLVLKENGNLVFDNWSSFDFPTDTILPNQSLALNGTSLRSRRDSNSYSRGKFEFQGGIFLVYNSTDRYWSSQNAIQVMNEKGLVRKVNGDTFISADVGDIRLRRLTLDIDGNLRIYSFDPSSGSWTIVWQAIQEICTVHGTCGPNFICMSDGSDRTTCVCPSGFQKTSDGICTRKIELKNPSEIKFLPFHFVNFTSDGNMTDRQAPNFTTCESNCLTNLDCVAFAVKYDGKRYCVHHIGRLLNGYWSPGSETAMFVRVDRLENDRSNFTGMTSMLDTICPVNISLPLPPKESTAAKRNLAIICSLFAIELLSGILSFWAFLRKYSKYRDMARTFGLEFLPAGGPKRFTYAELKAATKDFSNVIGRGGFGIVYRGELPDHRIVAVKCLKNVGGGEAEFWAEVTIIARMHHLNLVRMWGFCAEKGQRMLVYEYIPNGSLDKYLFPASRTEEDENSKTFKSGAMPRRPILDWGVRYRIAIGVARAIAYLHEECLEWVLHCDIKPENILLQDDFCPKVSDFGLAKLAKKEDRVSMSKIRGTRGYMAPEWVKGDDPITAKADVYSFGMVLLEIVSGIRNNNFQHALVESDEWYLPRWAFEKMYVERNVEEILDRHILNSYDSQAHFAMVNRMVKTAMWCLQDRPEMRPSMGKVAKMLEGTLEITEPGKPTIFYLKET